MAQNADFELKGDEEAYQPRVQVTKKSQQEYEGFWDKLVSEGERAEHVLLYGNVDCEGQTECPEGVACGDEGASIDPAPEEELSFDERYEKLLNVVSNKPTHREILIRTLSFCQEQREFGVVEDAIQAYPEFPFADQNPYRLVTYLVEGGGLEVLEVDHEGLVIEEDRKVGLSEDELDDLIESFHLKTTEVGEKLANDLSPRRRLADIFSLFSDRVSFYTELLNFCKEPRKFKDIEKLFAGRDLSGLRTLHPESGLAIKPTVLVDNMEKAGALVWKKEGWILTKEGEAYLESIARASMV